MEIAFENALTGSFCDDGTAGLEKGFTGSVVEAEADEIGDVGLGSVEEGVGFDEAFDDEVWNVVNYGDLRLCWMGCTCEFACALVELHVD